MSDYYEEDWDDPYEGYDDPDDDEHEFVSDCGDPKCLMNFAPHMRSECHTQEMIEAYERECNPRWYDRPLDLAELERLRAENERLTAKCALYAATVAQQDEALAALRRPVEQSAEVERIRSDADRSYGHRFSHPPFEMTDDIRALLAALDTAARQLRDRVEMLGFVQDQLSGRNKELIQERELHQSRKDLVTQQAQHIERLQLNYTELRTEHDCYERNSVATVGRQAERIERLEAALRACKQVILHGVCPECESTAFPQAAATTLMHEIDIALAAAHGPPLAPSQHTAGSACEHRETHPGMLADQPCHYCDGTATVDCTGDGVAGD